MKGFHPIFAKLRWSKVLPQIMQLEKEKLNERLRQNPDLIVDAPMISKVVLGSFFRLIFEREISFPFWYNCFIVVFKYLLHFCKLLYSSNLR